MDFVVLLLVLRNTNFYKICFPSGSFGSQIFKVSNICMEFVSLITLSNWRQCEN